MKDVMKPVICLTAIIAIVVLTLVGISKVAGKTNGKRKEDEFNKYDYIVVAGEEFETKNIKEVKASSGYDKYYTIYLKDGTKIVANSYILRDRKESENEVG